MIIAYHRPSSLEDALKLLARPGVTSRVFGGGTRLNQPSQEEFEAIDLQLLGLDKFDMQGVNVVIGSMVTLQRFEQIPEIQGGLKKVVCLEATPHLRNMGTVGGCLISCDGRSPFGVAMLALDAHCTLEPGHKRVALGNILPLREEILHNQIMTEVVITSRARFAYETIARTPGDLPIVCAALSRWQNGRARLVLGGTGNQPRLAFDGQMDDGLEDAASNVLQDAQDHLASAEYRMAMARVLARRCVESLASESN